MMGLQSECARARFQLAMVVDDEPASRSALVAALAPWANEVVCAAGVEAARAALATAAPRLIVLDFAMHDGDAFDVLDVIATRIPQPVILVVSGAASVAQSFALAQRGVRSYLQKPFTLQAMDAAIEDSLTCSGVDLRASVCAAVGQRAIHEVEVEIRKTMLAEALARVGGSRHAAARLLSISRQSLQHMLRAAPDIAADAERGARDIFR